MPVDFIGAGSQVDWSTNQLRSAARLMVADLSVPFPTELDDIVRTAETDQDELQTLTITGTPAGGDFTLSFLGYTTADIAYNANAAAVETALELLSPIGTGGVSCGGGPLPGTPVTITFENQLGGQDVALIGVDDAGLTGGTTPNAVVTETTPGFGQFTARDNWVDLGPTKGGVNVGRNHSEEVFTVDQIQAELLRLPTTFEQSVSSAISRFDLEILQLLWEGGDITVDPTTGERTLPLGAPPCLRERRVAIGFQRISTDCGETEGKIGFFVFRKAIRAAAESTVTLNSTGDQATIPFTFAALADTNVLDKYARFGAIIEQG